MTAQTKDEIAELEKLVTACILGRASPCVAEERLRRALRSTAARQDAGRSVWLRALLGELLLMSGRPPAKARRQFRVALRKDPDHVRSWIGLAGSYAREAEAERCLVVACAKAEEQQDVSGHLAALEVRALLALDRGDEDGFKKLLEAMCGLVDGAGKLTNFPAGGVEVFFESEKGVLVIPYLEAVLKHILAYQPRFGWLHGSVRLLVLAYELAGMSKPHIIKALSAFNHLASTEEARVVYREAIDRYTKSGRRRSKSR